MCVLLIRWSCRLSLSNGPGSDVRRHLQQLQPVDSGYEELRRSASDSTHLFVLVFPS